MIENRAAAPAASQHSFVRGARQIGEVLGISETAVAHLLRTGKLSSPRKVGGFWWCERSRLLREFGVTDDTHSSGANAPVA
jgi:hypothetical protein